MKILTPSPFSFDECLKYLNRTDLELTYRVVNRSVYKLITIDGRKILINVKSSNDNNLNVKVLNKSNSTNADGDILNYIADWFDLTTSLDQFYAAVDHDDLFKHLTQKYYGLRMVKIPELFEAMSWSIIGQQINLGFAYQVKQNLVRTFGEYIDFEGYRYYSFPEAEKIINVDDEIFRSLKFSRQKTTYIKGISEKILSGELSKEKLQALSPEDAKIELMKIKGIGNWSANYIMMRCLGLKEAFPIEDVGLHHALKNQLGLKNKPTIAEVRELSKSWETWKGYRTYYLWHSLLNE